MKETIKNILKESFLPIGDANIALSASSLGIGPLLRKTLQNHKPGVHLLQSQAEGKTNKSLSFYEEKVKNEKCELIYRYINGGYDNQIFVGDNTVVELEHRGNKSYCINVLSQSTETVNRLIKTITSNIVPIKRVGQVFSIMRQGPHLSLSSVGNAGLPLEKENYSNKVLNLYNDVVDDLRSESPAGRIVIFEGEPGTGKTHLIKSLLLEVPDGMFVMIPPDMVSSLAGPEFLPLLLQNKAHYANDGPIIIVLEDADQCLVVRSKENMNTIQALLNLGDGILGSMLDLRIIATTNANKLQMEDAILRPGRLSYRVEVDALNSNEASALLKKLVPGNKEVINENLTLAKVYQKARKLGWKPLKKSK
jgi:hypothetical protein